MSQSSGNLLHEAKLSSEKFPKRAQDDLALSSEHGMHIDVGFASESLLDSHSQKAHTLNKLTQPSKEPDPTLLSAGLALEEKIDANDSDYADLIFSQRLTALTATTLDGMTGTDSRLKMVNRMALMLLCSDDAHSIFVAAVNDVDIGSKRFRMKLRRMIEILGRELRGEAKDPLERSTAVALRKVASHAAHKVFIEARYASRRQTRVAEPSDEAPQSDASVEPTDEHQESPHPIPQDEAQMYRFILSSMSYGLFKKRLLLFAHEPYEKRLLVALNSGPSGGLYEGLKSVAHLAWELSWVPPNLFLYSEDRSLGLGDRVKGLIEDTMQESWNWSPFKQRQHCLDDDWFRLSWKSVGLS